MEFNRVAVVNLLFKDSPARTLPEPTSIPANICLQMVIFKVIANSS